MNYLAQLSLNVASYLFISRIFCGCFVSPRFCFSAFVAYLLFQVFLDASVIWFFCPQASFGHFLPPFLPCKCYPGLSVVWTRQQQLHCLHGHHHSPAVMWLLDSEGRTDIVFQSTLTIYRSNCCCFVELVICCSSTSDHVFGQATLTYETRGILRYISADQARYPQNIDQLKQYVNY